MSNTNPTPYRFPGEYHTPTVISRDPLVVEVGFPNEDPETEDDCWLTFTFTHEGVVIDAGVSSDLLIGTEGNTYEEIHDRLH